MTNISEEKAFTGVEIDRPRHKGSGGNVGSLEFHLILQFHMALQNRVVRDKKRKPEENLT